MPDENTVLELKEALKRTEEEVIEKDKKLISLLENDSAKNELIFELKERLARLESARNASSEEPSLALDARLHDKNRKIALLLRKLKEKEALSGNARKLISGLNDSGERKNRVLLEFQNEIEHMRDEIEGLKAKLVKKDNAILDLIAKSKEKDKEFIELLKKNEFLLKRSAPKKDPDSERMNLFSKEIDENNVKEKENDIAHKDEIISSLIKQGKEKEALVAKLSLEIEKGQAFNKQLFAESKELRAALRDLSEREAKKDSEIIIAEKRKAAAERRFESLVSENARLKKEFSFLLEQYDKERKQIKDDLSTYVTTLAAEKERYEERIRRLLSEDARKEVAFKAKLDEMKNTLEKQNFLIIERERKEKEIVDDIGAKFAEIFALRNEISTTAQPKEFDEFFSRDEFVEEDINNIVSLFRRGLERKDTLPNMKKSLLAAGFDRKKIDRAEETINKEKK